MLRLRVAEYFDSVINEIDLYTETKIQSIKTQTEENWWNKRRQEQIDEVRRIERACLNHVNTLKVEDKEIESGEWMKRAFVEYCFTVEFDGLVYLVKANRYVEPKEKRFLDVNLSKGEKTVNVAIDSHQSLGVSIIKFEVNLRDYFLTDAPVIDISSGLDQCCRIKRAWISPILNSGKSLISFNLEDLTINECSLSYNIENADKEKKAVDVIKCLMTCRAHIAAIIVDLEYLNRLNPSLEMKALAQSVELNDPVKFYFSKRRAYFQEFGLSGVLEKYKNPSNLNVSVTNWQFISYISFSDVLLEDLEKADLSSLHSLESLDLKISATDKSSSDWMFLDACRASLEHLYIRCYERAIPFSLSCRTFSGMTKLKSLSLSGSFSVDTDSQEDVFVDLTQLEKLDIDNSDCTTPFQLSRKTFRNLTNLRELLLRGAFSIETNNQEELFADLIYLKKLVINVDEQMLASKWLIHSPTVEELRLSFVRSPRVASSQIKFRLPELTSLELYFYSFRIYFDLTDMMSCFSHVKKLTIASRCLDIMTKGWFNRLTSVEELELNLRCQGHINSQVFEEFGHLTRLKIHFWSGNTLDRCLLHKLVHLETVTFVNSTDQTDLFDKEDKIMFNGLNSLRTIKFGCNYRSYVYFENLGRFILVVT